MLGIICALKSEAPAAVPGAVVVVGGVGAENSRRAAQQLLLLHPLTALISVGYAGALSPDLGVGDVVVDTTVAEWQQRARAAGATLGGVTTAASVITSRAERAALAASTGAVAVDMESAAIAEVARVAGLPFASVKAVTDTTARDLVLDYNACRRSHGGLHIPRLLWSAVRTPQGVAELRQLWYASRIASRNLRTIVSRVWGSD